MSTSAGRVIKLGADLAIHLTRPEAELAGLAEGMSVVVAAEAGRVVVTAKTKPSLEQKLRDFDATVHGGEVIADSPVGAERIGVPPGGR